MTLTEAGDLSKVSSNRGGKGLRLGDVARGRSSSLIRARHLLQNLIQVHRPPGIDGRAGMEPILGHRVLVHIAEIQGQMAKEISSIPTITAVREDSVIQGNPILRSSLHQVEVGLPMPIEPQMRQIWDGMRGPYQLIMNGASTAAEGAKLMQLESEKRIKDTFL